MCVFECVYVCVTAAYVSLMGVVQMGGVLALPQVDFPALALSA